MFISKTRKIINSLWYKTGANARIQRAHVECTGLEIHLKNCSPFMLFSYFMRYKDCVYSTQSLSLVKTSLTYFLNCLFLQVFALDNTDFHWMSSTEVEDKFPPEFTKVQGFILFIKATVSVTEEGIKWDFKILQLWVNKFKVLIWTLSFFS